MALSSGLNYRFRMLLLCYSVIVFSNLIGPSLLQGTELNLSPIPQNFPTVTVRGFLNFKTTVDGTVLVFTSASTDLSQKHTPRMTSSESYHTFMTDGLLQDTSQKSSSEIEHNTNPNSLNSASLLKSRKSGLEQHLENNVNEPLLHQISDNAVLPATEKNNYHLDLITRKIVSPQNQYPTGLVTVLGETATDGLSATVFETKVIGTYIDGKYAQILQSTSHVITASSLLDHSTSNYDKSTQNDNNILDTSSVGLAPVPFISEQELKLKTELSFPPEELLENQRRESIYDRRQPQSLSTSESDTDDISTIMVSQIQPSIASIVEILPTTVQQERGAPSRHVKQTEKFPAFLIESSFQTPDTSMKLNSYVTTESLESVKSSSIIREITPSLPPFKTTLRISQDENTMVASNKNWRNSTLRIRYLTARRPSQTVRLNRFKVKLTIRQGYAEESNVSMPIEDEELDEDLVSKADEDIELGMENTSDSPIVVFQETTITSAVTLHVGRRKSIRTLTITTSVPLTVNPTDITAALQSSEPSEMNDYNSSGNQQYRIVTRTFTTTERALQTSVVPIYDGKSTMFHTVTESFFIMKLITAYRTLPLSGASILESLFDDQAETEVPTTLDVAANFQASVTQTASPESDTRSVSLEETIPLSVSLTTVVSNTNPIIPLGNAFPNNPLAAVYLGLHQLNAQMTLYSTVTDTQSYVTTETIYRTKTIRFYDGRSTRFRMISDPISTKKRTVTNTVTSVHPYINTQALQQQQQLQKLIVATQISVPQQFSTTTSIYTTVTTDTSLSTRIYTLIYNGYSTKFRTVTSTRYHPSTITVTSTSKVQIISTANVPIGYPYTGRH